MPIRKKISLFDGINLLLLLLFAAITFYPLWHEVSVSLSSIAGTARGGFFLWPRGFTWQSYHTVLSSSYIWTAYLNSALITIGGTFLGTLLTACVSYPLVIRGLPARKFITLAILFTMLFSGGMIPTYLLVKSLGMINTLWAVFIPTLISAYNVLIMRSFFDTLPHELEESAMIDGANPIVIFFRIILPLSTPVLATISLWEAVGLWNNFFHSLIYLNDKSLYTLPLLLRDIINGQQTAMETGEFTVTSTDAVIAATVVVTMIPMLCVYPFLQKYFTKGVMIGAVKS
ncbi:carbohydrate ABC transporter permease [Paenibacillus sp. IITD108]|uniref:carbohydrate ABC transporter permease n=1 Tax=Paenibacillus sp. IITD108 TaxID=3116649 RepID=UPI002F404281